MVYTNKLNNSTRFFVCDTSLFTIVKDKNGSANALNNNLSLISKWVFNWKTLINPDPNKPAQIVLFLRKNKVSIHPFTSRNNIQVEKASYQKPLGLFLDKNSLFSTSYLQTLCKVNKNIAVTKTLRRILLQKSLLNIYKVFLTPLIY